MDWKNKTLLAYGLGGLILGVCAGIITINNAEKNNKTIDLTWKESAKIGMDALNAIQKIIIK